MEAVLIRETVLNLLFRKKKEREKEEEEEKKKKKKSMENMAVGLKISATFFSYLIVMIQILSVKFNSAKNQILLYL